MTRIPIAIGRAVHSIFSFPKEGKEKDAIPIPHAIPFSKQDFWLLAILFFIEGQERVAPK